MSFKYFAIHILIICTLAETGFSQKSWKQRQALTSPCNVVGEFPVDHKIRLNGNPTWESSCPENRFITAVYSKIATEPFIKAKCCGNSAVSSLSWEISDLCFFSDGNYGLNEQWNIECEDYSVITGFRFVANVHRVRALASVKCSILKNKLVDKSNCTILDFDPPPVKTKNTAKHETGYDKHWQHQCPTDFALVGLYDGLSNFKSIQYGKCCKLIDINFQPYWVSNFTKNNGGFVLSDVGGITFKPDVNGSLIANAPTSFSKNLKFARLISPSVTVLPFCLQIDVKEQGWIGMFYVQLRTNKSLVPIATFTKARLIPKQIFIRKEMVDIAQLYIDVKIFRGSLSIYKVELVDEKLCKVDRCVASSNEGCHHDENCVTMDTYNQCVCKPGTSRRANGRCTVNPSPKTTGKQKGITFEPNHTKRKKTTVQTKKNETFTTQSPTEPTKQTSTKGNPNIGRRPIDHPSSISPWIYSLTGGACGIIAVVIILAGCLCYRKTVELKHGRLNSFEHEMAIVNSTNDKVLLTQQMSSETFIGVSTDDIYRRFMTDLGQVENMTPPSPSRAGSFLSQIGHAVVIDPTTGEPIYTKINRPISGEYTNTKMEKQTCKASVIQNDNAILEDENLRRPSCFTLMQPDYGEADTDDETNNKHFAIPGDDEEELLDELNELAPESVQISTKILGQGAFGLVKYGTLLSVKGVNEVAVKILKQRNGLDVSESDRVKFYQEAAIMSQFDHPNVIALFGVIVGKTPCMVLEYLSRGNLWKYLNKVRRIRQRENVTEVTPELHCLFLKMAQDIVAGMEYLAGLNFVHRDLAARNILLAEQLTCKIADFGLSRHFLKDDEYYTSHGGQIPVKWTAPEALQFKKYSSKSDVWSYGIVLWEIWSFGLRPYDNWVNDKVMKEVCEKAYRLPAPNHVPRLLYRLMIDCWHPDKNNRPSFTQLAFCLNHSNDRIIGKKEAKLHRTRSVSWNMDAELNSEDQIFDDLQYIYCKTE